MHSRKLTVIGLLSVLSILLGPALGQAFAADRPRKEIEFNPPLPPVGSVYAVNLSGSAHISGTDVVKHMSTHLELNVTSVKNWGVPTVSLDLVDGFVKLGDDTHKLDRGKASIIPVWRLKGQEYTEDGAKILTFEASLTGPIPLSTTDPSVPLVPGVDEKTVEIQILTEHWILNYFTGNIDRIQ